MTNFNEVMQAKHDKATAEAMPKFELAAACYKKATKLKREAAAMRCSIMDPRRIAMMDEVAKLLRQHRTLYAEAQAHVNQAVWG